MKKSLKSAISTLANKVLCVSKHTFHNFALSVAKEIDNLRTYTEEVNDQIPTIEEFEEDVKKIVNDILGAERQADEKAMYGEYYTAEEVDAVVTSMIEEHLENYEHNEEENIDCWIKDKVESEVEDRMTYYVDRDEIDQKIQEYIDENYDIVDKFGSKLEDYDLDDIDNAMEKADELEDRVNSIEEVLKEVREYCDKDAIPQPNESEYAMMKCEIMTLKEQVRLLNAQMGMLRQIAKEFLDMNGYTPTEE